jgi:serine/threonine protein kinase
MKSSEITGLFLQKSLPPNPHLVQYLGSAHSKLPTGGYEVFILMEFCSGGGIIDLLNKRLRDRLKEIEILNIFTDVCEVSFAVQPQLGADPSGGRCDARVGTAVVTSRFEGAWIGRSS